MNHERTSTVRIDSWWRTVWSSSGRYRVRCSDVQATIMTWQLYVYDIYNGNELMWAYVGITFNF